MSKRLLGLLPWICLAFAVASTATEYPYKGSKRCKACHARKDTGDQYGKWKAGPHSKAYDSLSTDKAKDAARPLGVEEPQRSEACLKCHTTTQGVEAVGVCIGSKPVSSLAHW